MNADVPTDERFTIAAGINFIENLGEDDRFTTITVRLNDQVTAIDHFNRLLLAAQENGLSQATRLCTYGDTLARYDRSTRDSILQGLRSRLPGFGEPSLYFVDEIPITIAQVDVPISLSQLQYIEAALRCVIIIHPYSPEKVCADLFAPFLNELTEVAYRVALERHPNWALFRVHEDCGVYFGQLIGSRWLMDRLRTSLQT